MAHTYCLDEQQWKQAVSPIQSTTVIGPPKDCNQSQHRNTIHHIPNQNQTHANIHLIITNPKFHINIRDIDMTNYL